MNPILTLMIATLMCACGEKQNVKPPQVWLDEIEQAAEDAYDKRQIADSEGASAADAVDYQIAVERLQKIKESADGTSSSEVAQADLRGQLKGMRKVADSLKKPSK